MSFTAQELLECGSQRKVKHVPLPLLGGEVCVRRMSGGDRDMWDRFVSANTFSEEDEKAGHGKAGNIKGGLRTLSATFAAIVLCDENGAPLFPVTGNDADRAFEELAAHAAKIADLDHEVTEAVWAAGLAFNGLGKKAGEDIAKNSEKAPSDGSGSNLPATLECPSPSASETLTPTSSASG